MLLEVFESFIDLCDDFETKNGKVDAYVEATLRELEINEEKAELKVLQESGTEDDLEYLYTEAENGALEKIKKALQAAIRAFIEFIKNLKTKIIRMITNAETKAILKKVGAKVKLNPFLARKKVKVIDKKKPLAVIKKYQAKVDSKIAKVSSGVFKEKDIQSITSDRNSFDTEYKHVVAGAAALVTTSVAKLMASIDVEVNQLPKHIDTVDKETSKVVDKLVAGLDDKEAIAAVRGAYTACANFRTKLGEMEASEHVDSIMYKLKVLKTEVLKYKDPKAGKIQGKIAKESYEEEDDSYDDLLDGFEESYEDTFDEEDDDAFYEYSADDLLDELDSLLAD